MFIEPMFRKQTLTNLIVLITLTLGLSNIAIARFVENPIVDFASHENLSSNDIVYKIEADLNEDGIDDIFLSSSSSERRAGKAGVSWQEYLSSPGGYTTADVEDIRPGISMPIDGVVYKRLVEINNKMAFVSFFSSGAGKGSIVAFYVDKANRIALFNFGQINIHEAHGKASDRTTFSMLMSEGKKYKKQTITKESSLTTNANIFFVDTLKQKKDDFYSLHHFVSDSSGGNRQRVYRKSDNKLVGYLENGLVFVPLTRLNSNSDQKIKGNNSTIVPQLRF